MNPYGDLEEKYPVLIALEYNKNKIGQIRMCENKYDDAKEIAESDVVANFVKTSVKPLESTLYTDGYIDFSKLSKTDYPLKIVKKRESNYKPAYTIITDLEKMGLTNALSCVCSRKKLSNYLNECCFKYNKRESKDNWFYELLHECVYPPMSPDMDAISKKISGKSSEKERQLDEPSLYYVNSQYEDTSYRDFDDDEY